VQEDGHELLLGLVGGHAGDDAGLQLYRQLQFGTQRQAQMRQPRRSRQTNPALLNAAGVSSPHFM
jgi:hypothetical protein